MTLFRALIVALVFFVLPAWLLAKEPLRVVTDAWPPYSTELNGKAAGMDVEITQAVLDALNIPVKFEFMPWKRCLRLIENGQADAILDASITPERKAFMHFPEEPVSEGVTVFFVKRNHSLTFTELSDLNGYRAGAVSGYKYCDQIDRMQFMRDAVRSTSLKQNLNMLLVGRLDFVVGVDTVGYALAREMDISKQITEIPNARYCRGGNYLAFAKKEGYDALASQFSRALQSYKNTRAYIELLASYGIAAPPLAHSP